MAVQDNRAVLSTLREAMARVQHREGIPMVVALVDERCPLPLMTPAAVRTEGPALAARVQEIRQAVAPTMREDDNGGVICALVIAAQELTAAGRAGTNAGSHG